MQTLMTRHMLAAMIAAGAVQALADGITVAEDTASTYVPTTIVNGNFESEPWMDFALGGDSYTLQHKNSSLSSGTITACSPNGVNGGWNTTENQPYRGTLFEYSNDLPNYNSYISNFDSANHFVEMNVNNSAVLYQDLSTCGNDVIRWSLKHAVRTSYAVNIQSMRVEIGAPECSGGNIVAAEGINENVDSRIQLATKAVYRASGITNPDGNTYGFNGSNLDKLSLSKTDSADNASWHTVTGVYVVPAGQSVTRFGFIAEMKMDENPSCGNLLDDITFSTLIGNLSARQLESYDVELKGYWGETDATKRLKVVIGSTTYDVDMTSVVGKNFKIVIPAATIGAAASVHVYHQDYEDAGRTIALMSVLKSWEMDYTGDIQTFTAPYSGIYQLRVWGAQGGWFDGFQGGGKGGYASCYTSLTKGETIYVYVGGQGGTGLSSGGGAGGWNGGGKGGNGSGGFAGSGGGGGATHISKVNNQVIGSGSGQCASLVGTDFIIVAGGGGGAGHPFTTAGDGGGIEGGLGTRHDGSSSEHGVHVTYNDHFYYSTSQSYGANGGNAVRASAWDAEGAGGGGGGYYGGTSYMPYGNFPAENCQDAGGCGGNSACNSAFAAEFSTIAGQREGNGLAQIVLLVSQDEIDAHVGKVIGADGKMYKTVAAAINAGTTASGIIAYWGWAGSVESGNSTYRGMAISLKTWTAVPWCTNCCAWYAASTLTKALDLKDGCDRTITFGRPESRNVTDIFGLTHSHQAAALVYDYNTSRPSGSSRWFVPSLGQWNLVAKALTGSTADISESDNSDYTYSKLSAKLTAAGASGLGWAAYWSSTEKDGTTMWIFDIGGIGGDRNGGRASTRSKQQCGAAEYLRAVFAFEDATDAVYAISYDANGGSGAPLVQTKDGGINLNLSGVAPTRAGYVFKGWNTAADGSGTSYESGATFTGNVDTTLYAQWGGYGTWAKDNNITGPMNETDASGVPNAFRYVFDKPEGDIKVVSSVDVVGTAAKMTTPEIQQSEGITVKYELDQVAASGEVLSEGAASTSADALGINFASVESNAFFKAAVVLESTDGTSARTKVLSDTTIGVLAVTNAVKTAIFSVPFISLADGGQISVSNLVHTANLANGAKLQVMAGDTLYAWTLANGQWVEDQVIGQQALPADAATVKLARGKGFWLTLADQDFEAHTPVYLVGKVDANSGLLETELEAATAANPKVWNLVAPPSVEPVDLDEVFKHNDGSTIQVPPANTNGVPRNYTYENGKWGYAGSENGIPKRIESGTLPPGRGFWYINRSTNLDKKIQW